jgi:hypothetical protein
VWADGMVVAGGGAGFGPKTGNRAFVARFRAHCAKQRCGVTLEGGGCEKWHGGGGGAARSIMRGQGAGFGPKTRIRTFVAQLRACHAKWRWEAVLGGGGCDRMAQRWRGGCAFANARSGGGLWAKNTKPSTCRSVTGVPCEMAVGSGAGRW